MIPLSVWGRKGRKHTNDKPAEKMVQSQQDWNEKYEQFVLGGTSLKQFGLARAGSDQYKLAWVLGNYHVTFKSQRMKGY